MKFTKDTTLKEVYDLEKGEEILSKYAVPCVTCPMAKMEMDTLTLGQISDMYNIDLDSLLKELNSL